MRDTAINKQHGGPFANDPMRDVSVDALVESIVGDHGQVPQPANAAFPMHETTPAAIRLNLKSGLDAHQLIAWRLPDRADVHNVNRLREAVGTHCLREATSPAKPAVEKRVRPSRTYQITRYAKVN